MSSSFVVELNQNLASWSRPGEFECTLAQPISINEGDQLSFRQCSIDSNITDQDTILLTQDQVLSATFSYYEVNYDGTDKQSVGAGGGTTVLSDYKYYTAYNDVETVTVTGIDLEIVGYKQAAVGNIAAGSYIVGTNGVGSQVDPAINFSAIFTYISPAGEVLNPAFTGSNVKFTDEGNIYYTDNTPGSNATLSLQVTPFTMRSGSLQFANVKGYWPGARDNESNKKVTFGDGAYVPRADIDNNKYDNLYQYIVSDFKLGNITYALTSGSTGIVLDIQTVNVILKAGRYDPQSLAVEITQLFSAANGIKPNPAGNQLYTPVNPFIIRTDDPQNANMVFNQVPATTVSGAVIFENLKTYKYYNPASPSIIPPYFVGATEISLEYNVGGGQVFQLSYAHTPMSDPARPGEQDLALYVNGSFASGDLTYNVVTSATGIVFHDLQPISFWQDKLGLRDKLIVPLLQDTNGLQYYTLPSMERCITYGFQGLSSFLLPPTANPGTNPVTYPNFRKMSPYVPTQDPLYLNVTGQSRAIIGDTITVNTVGGYFLIECLNAFRSTGGYIDTTENRRYISAIVSTQYDSNNVITGFSDSDIAGYVHRGASYLISSVVIRILNPLTKQPVTTLGPNNCIWLQIQKQAEIQGQTVAHPKKKPIIIKRGPALPLNPLPVKDKEVSKPKTQNEK